MHKLDLITAHTQRFVTVSARRATVWDGKSGEALTTLTSERLLGNAQADITAFSLDHQVCPGWIHAHTLKIMAKLSLKHSYILKALNMLTNPTIPVGGCFVRLYREAS